MFVTLPNTYAYAYLYREMHLYYIYSAHKFEEYKVLQDDSAPPRMIVEFVSSG